MSDTRVIKRYANRKLYDTQRSRYVTLDQIADLIRAGQDVKVVDNNSKDDLTSITLAQIIFEQEKKQNSFLPLSAMKHIIQSGGESLSELASQAGARVRSVFGKGTELAQAEEPTDLAPSTADPASHSLLRELHDLRDRSQSTFDELSRRMDERLHKVVETLAPWTALEREVGELRQRTAELEKRLAESERSSF